MSAPGPPPSELWPGWRTCLFAGLDLIFACLYVLLALLVARTADGSFEGISFGFAALAVLAGIGTVLRRRRWALWMAVLSCATVLLGALILLAVVVVSSAYLSGVYGALGKGASIVALVAAALIVELYVLWPAFQLRFLYVDWRAGREGAGA